MSEPRCERPGCDRWPTYYPAVQVVSCSQLVTYRAAWLCRLHRKHRQEVTP